MLTWNRYALVQRTLESLSSTLLRSDVELLIWDNGSHDGTRELVQGLADRTNIHAISSSFNFGVAPARAAMLPLTTGDIVISIDSDVIIESDGWIDSIADILSDPKIGAVGVDGCFIREDFEHYWELTQNGRCDVVCGWCQAIPRHVIDRGVQFDSGYGVYFFEDYDICLQVLDLGLQVVCSSRIGIKHDESFPSDYQPPKQWEKAKQRFNAKWSHRGLVRSQGGYSTDIEE
jgi:GT2 family glycosyltransferase